MKKSLLFLTLLCFVSLAFIQNGFSQMAYNTALTLNGTNAYFAVPNEAELNPTTAITLEAWVNPSTLTSTAPMCIVGKNWASSYMLAVFTTSSPTLTGRLFFYPKGGGGTNYIVSRTPIQINKWTHIAVTYDGTTTRFYLNAQLDTSSTALSGAIATNTDSLYIGRDRDGANPNYFFNGLMDNVRIWNYAKSMFTEINRDMNIPLTMHLPTGLYTGLMASWLFNNTSDWSGAVDNNGYLRGGADYVDYSQKLSVYCSYNNSVILDGTTAYLAGGNSANYNATTGITIEAWFKRDTSAGTQPATQNIVNKSGGTTRYDYGIYFNLANNNIVFAINDGTQSITSPTSSVTLSRWYHVAGTYEQSTGLMKLYLNGDSVAGAVISGNPAINNNPDSLCIGGIAATNYSANKFRGQIDGIRIWKDFVKTPAQVKGEMYKSRIQDAANLCSEITFDTYTNLVHAPNNGWGYGVPLMFNGTAKVSSSNHGLLTEQTSPMLVANELDFYGTSYNLISTKRFFIPDNLPAGVTDSIYFSVGGTITDITAFLLLNHTWVSDMRVTLIGPTGISVMLTPSSGTGAGAGIMTIFTSSADSTINYNNIDISPFSPKIKPANPFTPFIGTQRQGWWKLKFVDVVAGDFGFVNGWGVKLMSLTGTGNETSVPYKFDLAQNYPNPFNPVTNIKYQIAKDVNVSIKLYDMLGREIQTLVNEFKNPGFYEINFDGTKLSSGIYFYKITAGDFTDVKKMTLLK